MSLTQDFNEGQKKKRSFFGFGAKDNESENTEKLEEVQNEPESVYSKAQQLISEQQNKIIEQQEQLVSYEKLMEEKQTEIQALSKRNIELFENIRNIYNDFENQKKRHASDLDRIKTQIISEIFRDLTNVVDLFALSLDASEEIKQDLSKTDLDEALNKKIQSLFKSIAMIQRDFFSTLAKNGIEKISVKEGDEFNMDEHEAISSLGEGQNTKIVQVVSNGYKIKNQVFKHAKVIVG